ncbi:MAG: hypothetical protein WC162_11530 [Sphaerochaetaceae bacterium]
MKKKTVIIVALFIFITCGLFAGAISEANSWLLPRYCINSESKMFDLTSTMSCNTIPASNYNDETVYDGQVSRFRSTLRSSTTVTIEPGANGWFFVNENNVTMKRPFTLKGYRYKWKLSSGDYSNTSKNLDGAFSTPVTGDYYGNYSFTLPSSSWGWDWWNYQCETFYEEEIVFELPSYSSTLEAGFYYADFVIVYHNADNTEIRQSMRIKGYVNMPVSEVCEEFSFSVSPTNYTYSVNLEDTTTYFEVVDLDFANSRIETLSSSPTGSVYNDRFTVYIAPTSIPTATTSQYQLSTNPYVFINKGSEYQTRTEKNTIEYEIFSNSSGGIFDSENDNGILFKMDVPYSYEEIGAAAWGNTQYLENWKLEDQKIYIKISPPSDTTIVREAGSYYSNLYFFVYSND